MTNTTKTINNEQQATVKEIIKDIQELALKPDEYIGHAQTFADMLNFYVDRLVSSLGMPEMILGVSDQLPTTIKEQIKDAYIMNDNMITGDPNHTPKFTDGTPIKVADLAEMNMNTLEYIADLLGFELEDDATPIKDDSLSPEDKLNVEMLNKLNEVQEHILNSKQSAVSMNQVQTSISLLKAGLGVVGKVED